MSDVTPRLAGALKLENPTEGGCVGLRGDPRVARAPSRLATAARHLRAAATFAPRSILCLVCARDRHSRQWSGTQRAMVGLAGAFVLAEEVLFLIHELKARTRCMAGGTNWERD